MQRCEVHAGKNRIYEDAMSRGFDGWRFCERVCERLPQKVAAELLQLRVFVLGLLQEGEVGVGVLPETQKRGQSFASL